MSQSTPNKRAQLGALRLQHRLLPIIERYDEVVDGSSAPRGWLLPFRPLFREILTRDIWSRVDLAYLLEAGDPRLQTIIVMLLGKCASRRNLRGIDRHTQSSNPMVRKQVAKALLRLEAAAALTRMARDWPDDEWVHRFAREKRGMAFSKRLSRFVANNVDASQVDQATGNSPMTYWARDRYWHVSPPKNRWFFRRILMRIQRWVRGPNPR